MSNYFTVYFPREWPWDACSVWAKSHLFPAGRKGGNRTRLRYRGWHHWPLNKWHLFVEFRCGGTTPA